MRDKNFIQQLHALARGDIFLTTIVTTCVNNLRSNQPPRALEDKKQQLERTDI